MNAVDWIIKDLDKVYEDIISYLHDHPKQEEMLGKIDELQNLVEEYEG